MADTLVDVVKNPSMKLQVRILPFLIKNNEGEYMKKIIVIFMMLLVIMGCTLDLNPQDGIDGIDGTNGQNGVSILSVDLIHSEGLVDTYALIYSDGSESYISVTNGKNGIDGSNGIDGTNGINGTNGVDGIDGIDGVDGVSIVYVGLVKTEGLVDTYEIAYSDGSTTYFNVTNGANGQDGTDGLDGKDGINGVDGTHGLNGADGSNGTDGKDGISIVSTELMSSKGLVDTYVINYSDGSITTFTVTNGSDGDDGLNGTDGVDGQDGLDASIPLYIVSITLDDNGKLNIAYSDNTTEILEINIENDNPYPESLGEWRNGVTYWSGDVVEWRGAYWKAIWPTGAQPGRDSTWYKLGE